MWKTQESSSDQSGAKKPTFPHLSAAATSVCVWCIVRGSNKYFAQVFSGQRLKKISLKCSVFRSLKCSGDQIKILHRACDTLTCASDVGCRAEAHGRLHRSCPCVRLTTRWNTTISSKNNLPHAIVSMVLCGAHLVT